MKKTITIGIPDKEEVQFFLVPHPEVTHPSDGCFDSGDEDFDDQTVADILLDLESNEWAWCCVEVRAEWGGLESHDYVGCCSYKSAEDFMASGYWDDMKERAYKGIVGQLFALESGNL